MKYRVKRRYAAATGELVFAFHGGEVVNLDDDVAAWLESDSPGLLERVVDKPPQNRQMKPASKRAAKEEAEG